MTQGEAGSGPHGADRRNNFDFLRFLLATIVVLAHSFYVLGLQGVHVGSLAVLGFFGISGFLVTGSWQASAGLGDFLRKRALRIWPGFAVVVLFDHLVVAPLATGEGLAYLRPRAVLREILTLQHLQIRGVFEDLPIRAVNGSLWSIPYEAVCYLLLAGLGVVGLVRRRAALTALAGLVWAVSAALPLVPGLPATKVPWAVLPYVAAFLVGGVLRLRGPRVEARGPNLVLVGLLLLGTAWDRVLVGLVWPVALTWLVLGLAFHRGLPLQGWGRRGDFSYGLYLYAFPVQQLLVLHGREHLAPLTLFVAAMALTLPLAVASWFLVERPALRWKGRSGRPA